MARKSRGISDKRVNTLLKRISKIRLNYKENIKYIKAQYANLMTKSVSFERTKILEDEDNFDINYEIIMSNPNRIKTNKTIRKRAINFIKKYKVLGQYKKETTAKRFGFFMRNEWLGNFREMKFDDDIINRLYTNDLYHDSDFWRTFFNSRFYVQLYKHYTYKDRDLAIKNGRVNENYHTIWGEKLNEFIDEWLNKKE